MTCLSSLRKQTGMALVLITHDMGVVAETAERVVVQYAGQQVERQSRAQSVPHAAPPLYGGASCRASRSDRMAGGSFAIPGMVPSLFDRPNGCLFNPRCPHADDKCRTIAPPRQGPELGEALCHYPVEAQGVAA